MDPVSGCSLGWFSVFRYNIVPIDGFLDRTVHPGLNLFHHVVTALCYTILDWGISATKLQVNTPLTRKSSEFSAAEGWVIVHEELLGWAPLEEHCLQLVNHDCQVMSYQLLPNWEVRQLASKNDGHHSMWYPSLVSTSSHLPPVFLSPSEFVLGLSTGIPHTPVWLT